VPAIRIRFAVFLLVLPLLGLAACGSTSKDAARGGSVVGDSLTVYSGLPLRGPFAERMRALVNGEKLAISDAGGKVGDWTIKYVSLDDAAGSDGWDPSVTADNARTAAQDPTTIAYLGDADFGATAVSLPILNEAGVAQISPASTYPGFTGTTGATEKGEPQKYQPSGVPTFARVVPSDIVEGQAQALYQRREGCTRTYVLQDKSVDGRAQAAAVVRALPAAGIAVAGTDGFDIGKADQKGTAEDAATANPDCVFVGANSSAEPTALWQALLQQIPGARIYGPADLARPAFLTTLSAPEQAATRLTQPTLPRSLLNARARDVMRRYRERFAAPAPQEMLYGYEAMALTLETLRRAGDRANERTYVAELVRRTPEHDSVLGRYAIRPNGDTTLRRFSGYRVAGGDVVFDRVLMNR
jgi:branched-chain amino acid transport system substrate-binding protein